MTKPRFAGRVVQGETEQFKSGSIRMVAVADLSFNPENERTYVFDEGFARSIAENGILSPLHIYEDGVVDNGNRRLFHIQTMGEHGLTAPAEVPTIVVQRPANATAGVLRRLNVNDAEQFPPMDLAVAFAKLRADGMNDSQIAKQTPFTSAWVGKLLTIHEASDDIKNLVREGRLSADMTSEMLRREDAGEEVLLAAWAMAQAEGKEKATRRHVEAVIASLQETEEQDETGPLPSVSEVLGATGVETPSEDEVPFDVDQPEGAGDVSEEPPFDVDGGDDVAAGDNDQDLGEFEPTGETQGDEVAGYEPVTGDETAGQTERKPQDPNAFTAKVARDMLMQFLPAAQDLLDAEKNSTPEELAEQVPDFIDALRRFVMECEAKGLKAYGE